ncbi:SET domain-containing protein [Polychaeton citri CBS 116435]|uniref:SET domain-containing protein n=1 Tax=Polychaeton citri CBS 116435 TaxID=1314669 RepID=A0A9P4Q5I7_9PEZI|nr:SET domain-containing protein [Polychaeton citri CBS 116435]
MSAQFDGLLQWLCENGGYLHPNVQVAADEDNGVHWRATANIQPDTTLSVVPHSLALSYLNALVDDAHPALKSAKKKLCVENIGFFYLMTQYLAREKSFWKPYLDTLPQPDTGFTTPLWFDDPDDTAWLDGTDVYHSSLGRRKVYERYWHEGVALLSQAGIDTEPYTWDLFRWAITIFTSRSFSSRAIAPQDSKYWAAYKTNSDGRRQAFLLDMSHSPAEDLDFPVLFPMQDVPNHHHNAHVDWVFDPGRFSINASDNVEAGGQIWNNYGAKGNDELLLGYGFCIADNPNDSVMLTLKPPSAALQRDLRAYHPGYFREDTGDWNGEKATFKIHQLPEPSDGQWVGMWSLLPEPLLELMLYILRFERDVPFKFIEHPLQFFLHGDGKRYLPHIARMIVQSLMPKLQKLQNASFPAEPSSARQRYAAIYRDSQLSILQSITVALRAFTRSFRYVTPQASSYIPGKAERKCVFAFLEEAITNFYLEFEDDFQELILGLEASTNSIELDVMIAAGWEEDLWVLLLCAMLIVHEKDKESLTGSVVRSFASEYGVPRFSPTSDENGAPTILGVDHEEERNDLMQVVEKARERRANKKSFWHDGRWSERFIAQWGGRILRCESTMMMVKVEEDADEEARLVVYLQPEEAPHLQPILHPI